MQTVEVDFNDIVEPGQVIARIDPSTFQARVNQAEAALASAQAGLAEARASALNSEREYQRKRELAEKQLVSVTERDLALAQRDQAKARVQAAQAQIQQQQANLNSARLDLAKTIIRSPVKGTVTSKPASLAAFSTAAEPASTIASAIERLPRCASMTPSTLASSSGSFAAQPLCGASRTRAPLAPPRWSELR